MAIALSLGILIGLSFFLLEPIQDQYRAFVSESPRIARDAWMKLQPILRQLGLNELDPASLRLEDLPTRAVESGMNILGAGVTTIVTFVTVLFTAVFWAFDPAAYRRGLSMVAISLLTTFLLWVVGIPYFLLFGIAAGMFEIIPFLGPVLAFMGPFLLALSISQPKTLWIIFGFLVIQNIAANVVVPRAKSGDGGAKKSVTFQQSALALLERAQSLRS